MGLQVALPQVDEEVEWWFALAPLVAPQFGRVELDRVHGLELPDVSAGFRRWLVLGSRDARSTTPTAPRT
jgi:hypothetical protein